MSQICLDFDYGNIDNQISDIISGKYQLDVQATFAPRSQGMETRSVGMTLSAEEEAELAALMSDDD